VGGSAAKVWDMAAAKSRSFPVVLEHWARTQPDRVLFRFVISDEQIQEITYREFHQRALRMVPQLLSKARSGDRIALLYPPGAPYITAFFACLLAGVIAVPCYPPRNARQAERTRRILTDCGAALALTAPGAAAAMRTLLECPDWLELDPELEAVAATDLIGDRRPLRPDDIAFLQYTSGSTGDPKGVMVSHGNLIANAIATNAAMALDSDVVNVTWLPPYHDMGLIGGLLQSVFTGGSGVILPSMYFLQQPVRWLKAISRYRGTLSGAPNFAFELCCQRITNEQTADLDLSTWKVAFCGSEPVRAATLERFTNAFARCGFRPEALLPVYGMAEMTLLASSAKFGMGPRIESLTIDGHDNRSARPLVSSGRPVARHLAIVDPDSHRPLADGEVGEIWIAGDQVACGYWNKPELTEKVFGARLRRDGGSGTRYLRTGDLGLLRDGELFVCGRLKDMIILRGQNVYPQDVEVAAFTSHPALRVDAAAAFGHESIEGEQLVVVQELNRRERPGDDIFRAIAASVFEHLGVQPDEIVLTRPGGIPRTSSGKIRRRQCALEYRSGALAAVARWRRTVRDASVPHGEAIGSARCAAEIERWLCAAITWRLGIPADRIDPDQPFASYGVNSLLAAETSDDLARWLGHSLPATLLWDYPSPAQLARHLAGGPAPAEARQSGDSLALATTNEPIAVIGLGCRFPGADDLDAFWNLLASGSDAVRRVPRERIEAGTYRTHLPAGSHAHRAGFLDQVDQFDAAFFNIAPVEATHIDPQQRLLLEVGWRALEHAGLPPANLAGSQTGVFVGISNHDYGDRLEPDPTHRSLFDATGNALSIAANRLSYVFDLRGPSVAVDTACSSSLLALHLACQSLRGRECSLALVGGANLILSDLSSAPFVQAGLLSADGRCRAFDAKADGYVRGEGCGMVVLKRLSDAERDGDAVHALILGSATAQDGRSNGMTAPSGRAQEAVVAKAMTAAGVGPEDIDYVETHGTGTRLGDPIELNALKNVIFDARSAGPPCVIGSVKTNIGHLEPAAGIASLIKVVLMLQRGAIPPHLHFEQLNPECRADPASFDIPRQLQPWNKPRRYAGINSFGFGGTLVHAIIGAAPYAADIPTEAPWHLVTVSARSRQALAEQSRMLGDAIRRGENLQPAAVSHLLNRGRSAFPHRRALVVNDRNMLIEGLSDSELDVRGGAFDATFFLFTGQGAQRPHMAKELYHNVAAFRDRLDCCADLLRPHIDFDLRQVLYSDATAASELDRTDVAQPALFAIGYALAGVWQDLGLRPRGLIGHSFGEYVAACLAGVFTLDEALRLRGRLMQSLPPGAMLAVDLDEAELRPCLSDEVCLAAVNGPGRSVVAGATEAIESLARRLRAQGTVSKRLRVSHAFHSDMMAPIADRFADALRGMTLKAPAVPFVSNLTGTWITAAEATTPDYWVEHLLKPVRFADGLAAIRASVSSPAALVEVGPGWDLTALAAGSGSFPAEWEMLPSLSRHGERSDLRTFLSAVASLWSRGQRLDLRALHPGRRPLIALPGHPFERARHWLNQADKESPAMLTAMPNSAVDRPLNEKRVSRREHILNELQVVVARVLRLPVERVDTAASLLDLGADSIVLIHALREIEQRYGVRLGIRQLYEDLSSLSKVAAYLDEIVPPSDDELALAATPVRPAEPDAATPEPPTVVRVEAVPIQGGSVQPEISDITDLFARQIELMRQQLQLLGHYVAEPPKSATSGTAPLKRPEMGIVQANRSAASRPAQTFFPFSARAFAERPSAPASLPVVCPPLHISLSFFGHYDAIYRDDKYRLMRETALFADRHGFEALWLPERHFHAFGGLSPNPSVLAAALARETSRVALRAGSVVLPLHHPVRIAEEWAVVDNLSEGRVGIAAASGWHPNDFVFAPDAFEGRRELTFKRLEEVRALWRGEKITAVDGAGCSIEIGLFPMPKQAELPVWVTVVGNPETYRRAGAIGAGILTNLMEQTVDELAAKLAVYRQARQAHGHPGPGDVAVLLHTHLRDDAEQARREAREPFKAYLDSALGLFQNLLRSSGSDVVLEELDDQDRAYLLDSAVDRYLVERALIGDPAVGAAIVKRLNAIGVSEIACFIDFGVAHAEVVAGLEALRALKSRLETETASSQLRPLVAGAGELPDGRVVLSLGQQRMWMQGRISGPWDASHNLPIALELHGPLDAHVLATALADVTARHLPLRTLFVEVDGELHGRLLPPPTAAAVLPVEDAQDFSEQRLMALADAEAARPFDLSVAPALRARLLRILEDRHLLLITLHHIGADGMSIPLLVGEISTAYAARLRGAEPVLPKLRISYPDIAAWQRARSEQEAAIAEQISFWRRQMAGAPQLIGLQTDYPRLAERSRTAGQVHISMPEALVSRLHARAAALRTTFFSVLLAGYALVLSRMSGEEDVVIGSAVAGRMHTEAESLIGCFATGLPLRLTVAADLTGNELVGHAGEVVLESLANQDVPFERLVDELGVSRSLAHMPLVQVMLSWQSAAGLGSVVNDISSHLRLPGVSVSVVRDAPPQVQFDLSLDLTSGSDGGVQGVLRFDASLFDQESIERLAGRLVRALEAIAADPGQRIRGIEVLTAAERGQLLEAWNATAAEYPADKCIHELFEAQAAKTPDSVAVVHEDRQLTYAELNARATRLAHHLCELGVTPDDRVAICVERSIEMVVGLLAVLKAGGGYVPLDPAYPPERLAYMLTDSAPVAVLTMAEHAERLADAKVRLVCLDSGWQEIDRAYETVPVRGAHPSDLAYVLYTSGSTGRPKGVLVEHRQVVNYVWAVAAGVGLDDVSRYMMVQPLTVDSSVTVLYASLLFGGELHVVDYAASLDAKYVAAYVRRRAIDCLKIAPPHLQSLMDAEGDRVLPHKLLIVGGDVSRWEWMDRVRAAAPDCRIFNHYGPTEAAVGVTVQRIDGTGARGTTGCAPIGRPLGNARAYILDARLAPAPIGAAGDLYIGGAQVARGYLGCPDLTCANFIADPFSEDGSRLYRTGDRARFLADGSIEFLGRADEQIKVLGYRVEPEEITVALLQHAGVRQAAVVPHADSRAGILVAYAVLHDGVTVEVAELRQYLVERLPAHMVPAVVVLLDALPLTPHGKLDRRALPAPEGEFYATRGYEPPQSATEETLAAIWEELLRIERVGRHDNFFHVGGNSVGALRAIARIRTKFSVELSPRDFLDAPSLAELAQYVDRLAWLSGQSGHPEQREQAEYESGVI